MILFITLSLFCRIQKNRLKQPFCTCVLTTSQNGILIQKLQQTTLWTLLLNVKLMELKAFSFQALQSTTVCIRISLTFSFLKYKLFFKQVSYSLNINNVSYERGESVYCDEDNFTTQSKIIPNSFNSTEHNDILDAKLDLEKWRSRAQGKQLLAI